MIVVYQATQEELVNRQGGEESEMVQWSESIPTIGSTLTMASERFWQVVHVEVYQSDDSPVFLAIVAPINRHGTHLSDWDICTMRARDPNLSFYVLVNGKQIINYGWNMDGGHPTGELYNYLPAGEGEPMTEVPGDWFVESATTHHPTSPDPAYSKIWICECRSTALVAV